MNRLIFLHSDRFCMYEASLLCFVIFNILQKAFHIISFCLFEFYSRLSNDNVQMMIR